MIQRFYHKYDIDHHVKYEKYDYFTNKSIEERGYIVGYKYTTHPYLEKPNIEYAILKESAYEDYKNSLAKKEEPFQYCLDWIKEKDIIKVL